MDAVHGDWPEILEHLTEVIAVTPPGRLKEGRIQAALERLAEDFAIVDREVVLSHEGEMHRRSVRAGLSGWVATVLDAGGDALPPSRPESFGNKLDALAVDRDGRLLVIEVKPATELNGTAWTPLQVAVYHHLFSAWLKSAGDEAATVIGGMLEDRAKLGLVETSTRIRLRPDLDPRPVIALGADQHQRLDLLYGRFATVLDACRSVSATLDDLRVWSVSDTKIDPHPALPR